LETSLARAQTELSQLRNLHRDTSQEVGFCFVTVFAVLTDNSASSSSSVYDLNARWCSMHSLQHVSIVVDPEPSC